MATALAGRGYGRAGLEGRGRGGVSAERRELARLGAELDKGPGGLGLGRGSALDPGRVTTLIGRLFRVRYTPRGHLVLAPLAWLHPAARLHPGCGAG